MEAYQTQNLTPDERKCAERAERVWDEALTTYQLPEGIKFVLKFQTKLQVFHAAKMNKRFSKYAVGRAHYDREANIATVMLNRDAIKQNPRDMLEDTVAHEIAHIVCMVCTQYGDGHNQGWQEVCKRLGGSGKHQYAYGDYDMRIRKRRQYLYDVPGKGVVALSDIRHKELQNGGIAFREVSTGVRILKEHFTGGVR